MAHGELPIEAYTLAVDANTALVMGNRWAGSTASTTPEKEQNRDRLISVIRPYISSTAQPVRMKPVPGATDGFVDLDQLDEMPDVVDADGFLTSNPECIFQANPADCGEVALSGYSEAKDRTAQALLHVNRLIAGAGSHRDAVDYFLNKYAIDPATLQARLSPSARKESYAFPGIDPEQAIAPEWQGYLSQDEAGMWHVDFHGKTVDDLVKAGIPQKRMAISPIDTISSPDYFSNYGFQRSGNEGLLKANGLFVAIRVGAASLEAA